MRTLPLIVLCVGLPWVSFGQTGIVTSGGQPIPGATVTATQGERVLRTLSDERGTFQFTGMGPGTWTIESDMFGFAHMRRDVQVSATPTRIDVALQLQERTPVLQRAGQQGPQGSGQQGTAPAQDIGIVNDAPPAPPPDLTGMNADSSNG